RHGSRRAAGRGGRRRRVPRPPHPAAGALHKPEPPHDRRRPCAAQRRAPTPDRAYRLRRRRARRCRRAGDLRGSSGSAGHGPGRGRASLPTAGRGHVAVDAPRHLGQTHCPRIGRDPTKRPSVVIVVGGEALVDLVDDHGVRRPVPGGGPFNTAVALGRLGVPVAYLGTLSRDDHGTLLARVLTEAGVDVSLIRRSDAPTPVAVVDRQNDGGNTYAFQLAGTSFTDLPAEAIPPLP